MSKLWHDDIRPAPKGWLWARTNAQAKHILSTESITEISMDHDLGLHDISEEEIALDPELLFKRGTDLSTGYDLVSWMIENDRVPGKITVHSWNRDGARRMAGAFNEAGYDCIVKPYDHRVWMGMGE